MLIDFHTHIFPDAIAPRTIPFLAERCQGPAYTAGTAAGILGSMDQGGVTTSIVLPVVTKPSQFESINRFAAEINAAYAPSFHKDGDSDSMDGRPGRLLSFGGIHPDCEDYKSCLDKIKELGLKGIKLHPDYQGTFFNDIRYMRIIEYASELDLIVVTHAGFDVGIPEPIHCPPKLAREVIDQVQPKKLVLAHMGGMAPRGDLSSWEEVEEYLVGQNVWLDTAYVLPIMPEDAFERIARSHGLDRILFATDSPWQDQKNCVDILNQRNFTEDEKQRICSGNALKLLGVC